MVERTSGTRARQDSFLPVEPDDALADWPLVGRAELLRACRERFSLVRPRPMVIAGRSGAGKSRLASEVARIAARAGFTTRRVLATEASTAIPFGAFMPVLTAATPTQVRGGEAADKLRGYALDLIDLGRERPLLLLVDDAHLLDDLSATLILHLVETRAVTVLVTVKSGGPAPAPIVALWKDNLADRLELRPLEPDDIGEVLACVVDGPVDPAAVSFFASECGGDLHLLRGAVLGALEAGSLVDDGGVWRVVSHLGPPDRVVDLVEARLASISPAERGLLEVISFCDPIGVAELEKLADAHVAEGLERRGLLISASDGRQTTVGIVSPLYREVLRRRVPALRACVITRALAGAAGAADHPSSDDLVRVASWQLVGGGSNPERMLEAAALAGGRYELSLAEQLAGAAREAGAGFDADVLLAELASAQGRSSAAAMFETLENDAVSAPQTARAALGRLDDHLRSGGAAAKGMDTAERAAQVLGSTPWGDCVLAARAAMVLVGEGPRRAVEEVEPLLQAPTADAVARACLPGSYGLGRLGRVGDALALARRGRTAHEEAGPKIGRYPWMYRFLESEALTHADRFQEAEELASQQYQAGLANRSVEAQALFALQLGEGVADRGHVHTAVPHLRTARSIYRRRGRPQCVASCLVHLATALAVGRRPAEAEQALREHDDLGLAGTWALTVDRLSARGWVAAAGGNLRAACNRFEEAADEGERIGDLVGSVAALHSLARIGKAKHVAGRIADAATALEGPLPALRVRHTLAAARGDAAGLEAVSGDFARIGAPLLAAEAAADAAVAWRRLASPRHAAGAERQASWLALQCPAAATPALQQGQVRARLTPAEWETVQLAAAGRPNKEIARELVVSVRTVENRLQQAYVKLGVSRRRDLAEAMRTIGPVVRSLPAPDPPDQAPGPKQPLTSGRAAAPRGSALRSVHVEG